MAEVCNELVAAMKSGDVLVEAERRYTIIAQLMDPSRELREGERGLTGTEVKALSIEADRLMHKIVALRAERKADAAKVGNDDAVGDESKFGKVVQFDAGRFRKNG